MQHYDVIIIGAGLSGIGAARQLQDQCPDRRFAILESREAIGGTWDLFRYPGIRSDSDMYTMGYDSKPWREPKAIADGPSILAYIREAAQERGLNRAIHFDRRLVAAQWSSAEACWMLEVECPKGGGTLRYSCNWLLMCSGYYRYEHGYRPRFEGEERYGGRLVHPQHWPGDLEYAGKHVVVVGSGATAITLVPALAETASKVTMLQRSPSYVVSLPGRDPIARILSRLLPAQLAYRLTRWKNLQFQRWIYQQTRTRPEAVKRKLIDMVRRQLGPQYDVARHFTPRYRPWDQRLCVVPDGDFFAAIRAGRAEIVTDTIAHFDEHGIVLASGQRLDADIVVTATGLDLVWLGGARFGVDGVAVDFTQRWSYKGAMFSDVPNLVYTLGYINASWTLRSELVAEFACRLLNHMTATHTQQCTPRLRPEDRAMRPRPLIDGFTPNYLKRVAHLFPHQGDRDPWQNPQNYLVDRKNLRAGALEDGVLQFTAAPESGVRGKNPATEGTQKNGIDLAVP
ncbi:MAG: flavin-containing monooxygenase [Gammaproteobacteria bacterium]